MSLFSDPETHSLLEEFIEEVKALKQALCEEQFKKQTSTPVKLPKKGKRID